MYKRSSWDREGTGTASEVCVKSGQRGDVYTFVSRKSGVQTFTGHPWPKGGGPSESVMSVSEEIAALRADLERMKKEKELQKRKWETEFERLRRERSWGTSFDTQGGGNSADRRGTAASTMGPMWTREVSAAGGLKQNLPNFPRGIVPKFPVECSPSEHIAWEQRFEFFIADQDLRHTISPDASEIAVISCTNNAYIFGQFGEDLVLEHRRVWGYISEATADAPFENSLSLHFVCLEDDEGMVVASLSSRAAFACGGAGESSVHGGRRNINCSVHSPPVPGTSIAPPYSCRRSWFSGRGGRGRR